MKLATYIHENTTVTEFAKRIGKSRAQVHRYLKGENLTKGIIEKICKASGGNVTPADFFASAPARKAAA